MNLRLARGAAVAFAVVMLLGAALISFRGSYDPDLWWHLAHGRETAAGHFVRTNVFSFFYRDYPQQYTSWLFDLGTYVLWTHAGPAAIQVVQALLVAATLWTVAASCRIRSSAAATAAVCLFGWLIIEPRATPRPHVFSFLGLAVCVYLIERAREAASARPVRWAPLVIAGWANVHVECVFGVAVIGLFGLCEWLRPRDLPRQESLKVIALAAAALAATALNPYGFGLWRYLYENLSVPQVIRIAEVQPPYLPNYRGFFTWTIVAGVLLLVRWRRPTLAELATIALFGFMGFRHLRLTPMLFLVSAPLVARCIDDLEQFGIDRRAAAVTALVAVVLMARVPIVALVRELDVGRDALMPSAFFSEPAMDFARGHGLAGPAFTSMNLGGFVAWELYPSAFVFVDSRLQAYPPEYFRTIIEAAKNPEGWAALTAGVDWAVLSLPRVNEMSGVGQFNRAEWGSAYRDDAIEIVVRRTGPYGRLANR